MTDQENQTSLFVQDSLERSSALVVLADRLRRANLMMISEAVMGALDVADRVKIDLQAAEQWLLRTGSTTLRIEIAAARLVDLSAENDRLREQISESHTNARVTELVNECTRHETEARAAREQTRLLQVQYDALVRSIGATVST